MDEIYISGVCIFSQFAAIVADRWKTVGLKLKNL